MQFANTFWALVPPLIAIALALITKEAYSSLFVGIVVGALFINGFAPVATLDTIINDGFSTAIADNAGIFAFLVMLGILVALVNSTGAASAFGKWASKRIRSRAGALIASFILGVLIFIDDYFNCLTVGSVMRPLSDQQKISRAKLAFIIDATAAPICMIAPVSSWAAAVSGVASDLGINGIKLFIDAIPYNYYSLLMIVFVIGLAIMGFDYGPMAAAELKAYKENDVGSLGNDSEVQNSRASLWDMLIPVIVLIITCVIGLLYVGGFWGDGEAAGSVILAFGDTDAFVGLPWGSLIALIFAIIYLCCRRVISFKDAMGCCVKGFEAMVPAILILTFAVSLKNMTSALGAANYVESLMQGAAAGLYKMLPAIIFLVACGLAFSTGTSWGTFGILIPIVLPIFSADSSLLIIGISACLAGAVCGDHCSPISDTTIMASAGANCNHVQHVSTQLPYAITVAGVSFVNYVIVGFVQNALVGLITGIVLILATLFILKKTIGKTVTD